MAAVPDRDAARADAVGAQGPATAGPATAGLATGGGAGAQASSRIGGRSLLGVLLILTLLSGMIDAVCYLGLGRVFTANMTGNVVILGFAAAGAAGFSVPATLTSLGLFLVGAVAGGRLSRGAGRRSRMLIRALWTETVFVAGAAVVAYVAGSVSGGWGRYTAIALLAFAMGIRNSVVRRLAIPDMTTTVLTMTLTGLAADSGLSGGSSVRSGRRVASVLCMVGGAAAGAALLLHVNAGLPLVISACAAAVAAAVALASKPVTRYLDEKK